jgi:hypothetical protein
MNPIFQNESCTPFSDVQSPCVVGNLAAFAVNVSNAEQVMVGLEFARTHNLRVSIKNTGHE